MSFDATSIGLAASFRGFGGRGAVGAAVFVPPPAPGGYDYVIATDADWATIPAGLLADGGLIGVEPGAYTSKTLTATPSAPLVFRGTMPATEVVGSYWQRQPTAGAKARIPNLVLDGARRLEFEDLEIVSTQWGANTSCVILTGATYGDFKWRRNWIHAGYRGDPDVPFDPLEVYPELACIIPQFNSSGAVTSLIVTRSNVGDLLADGTYDLVFTEAASGNGISWSTGTLPVATFTVSGGVITATNLVSGGATNSPTAASIVSGVINNSTGILSKVIEWAGQVKMINSIPWAFKTTGVSGQRHRGDFVALDNLITDVNSSIKMGSPDDGGLLHIEGNTQDRIYADYAAIGMSRDYPGCQIIHRFNFTTRPFSAIGDPGDPHSDHWQLFANKGSLPNTNTDWSNIDDYGNVHIDGNVRQGAGIQGRLISDFPVGPPYYYYNNMKIRGNIVASAVLTNGLSADPLKNSFVYANTTVRYDLADPDNLAAVNVRVSGTRTTMIGNNISEGIISNPPNVSDGTDPADVDTTTYPNLALGTLGASTAYSTVFAGVNAGSPLPVTLDEAIAYYQPMPAHADKGATKTGYINYSARTINEAIEPPFVRFYDVTDADPSTPYGSGFAYLMGGPVSKTIVVPSGATMQVSDTADGASPTTYNPGSHTADFRDKFLQVTLTSDAGDGATVTKTLDIDGYSFGFSVTTIDNSEFPQVEFDGLTAYAQPVGAMGTDGRYLTIALRGRFPASNPAANTNLFNSVNGSAGVMWSLLTTGKMRLILRNAAGTAVATIDHNGASVCDGLEHEFLVSIDMEQTTKAAGASLYLDGVDQLTTTGAWAGGPGVVIGYSRTAGAIQTAFGGQAAKINDYGHKMFYANITERADLTSATVRGNFTPANIANDGSGVTGTQPHTLLVGNAGQWNAGGGINFGSGAAYTVVAGGVTDTVPGQDPW